MRVADKWESAESVPSSAQECAEGGGIAQVSGIGDRILTPLVPGERVTGKLESTEYFLLKKCKGINQSCLCEIVRYHLFGWDKDQIKQRKIEILP